MNDYLKTVAEFIVEVNSTNSTNEKINIVKNYECLKDLLAIVYDKHIQFNITSNNIKKFRYVYLPKINNDDLFTMLNKLSSRELTGNSALAYVNDFIFSNIDYKDIIYKIIDKNLETRTDAKLLNKAFPNLIPEFSVALANSYSDYEDKVDFIKDRWLVSRKLDGLRLITFVYSNGDIRFFSREGKEFFTLDVLKTEIPIKNIDYVLDGEICLVDENGNEDFQGIMKVARKKDYTIPNPKYYVFDLLEKREFDAKESKYNLSLRLDTAKSILFYENTPTSRKRRLVTHIEVLTQDVVIDKDFLAIQMEVASKNNWEGLILRKDTIYKGKRSNDLLKVKKFFDAEYEVVDATIGKMQIIDKDTGLAKDEELLSSVTILHKGNKVNVGSGFTLEERRAFKDNLDLIVGKFITVKYFEETTNSKDDSISLRFPTFKSLHGNKREV